MKKQIVLYVSPEQHRVLRDEAKANLRTIGQQVLARAFGLAGVVPAGTERRVRAAAKVAGKTPAAVARDAIEQHVGNAKEETR